MASVNRVIIIGNCARDPETRYMPDGGAITNVSIATSYRWKDKKTGDTNEETEFHRVSFFGRLAEIADEYLKKGSPVYVEGRLRTRKYQDKQTGQDRFSTEIITESMQLLGGRGNNDEAPQVRSKPSSAQPAKKSPGSIAGMASDDLDSVPF